MQAEDTRQKTPRGRPPRWRWAALTIVLAASIIGLAACGGGSPKASSDPSGAPKSVVAEALKYSECMRAHGVANFPDPNSQGNFESNTPINPNSTAFQTANSACKSLKPAGNVSAAQENQEFAKALKAAACIRANGYPNFPDPTMVNGSIGITLGNSNIDTSSPAFEQVATKCGAPAGLVP